MIKNITCIECPKSCFLAVDIENYRVIKVSGNQCFKGEDYAVSEVESPARILTSTVLSEGLSLKMIPVRTNNPIPKDKILEAACEIRKIRIARAVRTGDIIVRNFLGLGVDLVVTRDCL